MEVLQPAESQGLHRVLHPTLPMPNHLHQARDAHAKDGPDARRPRGLRQVDLARPCRAVVIADVICSPHVADLGEDEVLQRGLLLALPGAEKRIRFVSNP